MPGYVQVNLQAIEYVKACCEDAGFHVVGLAIIEDEAHMPVVTLKLRQQPQPAPVFTDEQVEQMITQKDAEPPPEATKPKAAAAAPGRVTLLDGTKL